MKFKRKEINIYINRVLVHACEKYEERIKKDYSITCTMSFALISNLPTTKHCNLLLTTLAEFWTCLRYLNICEFSKNKLPFSNRELDSNLARAG